MTSSSLTVDQFWQKLFGESLEFHSEQAQPLYALRDMGVICVEGPDAENFLQGQLTTDVVKQQPGEFLLSGHCDHKGRLNANFFLCRQADDLFFLILPSEHCEQAQQALNKYAVFSKVKLDVQTEHFAVMSGVLFDYNPIQSLSSYRYRCQSIESFNFELGLLRLSSEKDLIADCMSLPWQDEKPWQQQRIANGIGLIHSHSQSKHIPQMLNMDLLEAIDWNKGCYTGQEIIARMHYRGSANRRCFVFKSTETPSLNLSDPSARLDQAAILNQAGENIGEVLEWMIDEDQKLIGLAVLKLKALSDKQTGATPGSLNLDERKVTISLSPPACLASEVLNDASNSS